MRLERDNVWGVVLRIAFSSFRQATNRIITAHRFSSTDYEDAILPFGGLEAQVWGEYAAEVTAERGKQHWTPRTLRDSALAATARAWSLTVVTRDRGGFPFVDVLNPFD